MSEDIDYQAIAEGLQHDLEQARLTIVKLKHARTLRIDLAAIRDFATDNYALCLVVIFAVYYIGSLSINLVKAIKEIRGRA